MPKSTATSTDLEQYLASQYMHKTRASSLLTGEQMSVK